MAGCGSNCSAGCCKDFSSRAERLPNLLSVEVTGEIFAKAVRNMTLRAAQRAAGMMSNEEYEEAKSKLVRWLVNAFSGENPHYEADSEWHGNGGLADYLAETLDYPTTPTTSRARSSSAAASTRPRPVRRWRRSQACGRRSSRAFRPNSPEVSHGAQSA